MKQQTMKQVQTSTHHQPLNQTICLYLTTTMSSSKQHTTNDANRTMVDRDNLCIALNDWIGKRSLVHVTIVIRIVIHTVISIICCCWWYYLFCICNVIVLWDESVDDDELSYSFDRVDN